ncbi:sugar ABC transporter substrate-binding protein [Agrococcus jejuensis]|uniref:Carbohydrate ABC transporter substrate-binding protein, CUT1 family n=1 Tax=Agrococcus jejuensis TaxID=399736 RepID=A0A1G8BFC0_9MICO|nr:sugar ABC transporter substrate-binding protein [Agrococcus jejuensis]SDH31290.1 carbohydrate ABC transporter substrate-binding protein, CUT1 family [Agrococcus jejuensis]
MRRTTITAAIATTAATALILTGCGRPDADEAPAASAEEVSFDDLSGDIEVWAMGAEGEALPALADAFMEEHPDTSITVTPVPWDAAYDRFSNAITAGSTPDAAMVGTTWMGDFAGQGALEPTPPSFDDSQYFEGAQATTEVDGITYGLPWYVETRMVYYRTDIAAAAGYDEVPADWAGFQEMAAAMQQQDGVEWGMNLQPGGTGGWQTVLPLAWSNGAEIATDDAYALDTPEMVEATEYFQGFFDDGIADPNPPEGQTEADFVSGRIPMFLSGPWMMSIVEELGGEGFDELYDVAPVPANDGAESVSFVGGSNLAVFQETENRDLAWAFVDYLTQPEVQVEWYELTSALPSVQSAWDEPVLADDARLSAFGTELETAVAPPSFPSWEQVATELDQALERVAKAGEDPAEALAGVQAEAEDIGTGQ